MLNTTAILTRSSEILASEIDDELVMMSLKNNAYYGLDRVSRAIWELLDTPMSTEQLVHALQEHYEVSTEQCISDITPFLEMLIEKKLLQVNV